MRYKSGYSYLISFDDGVSGVLGFSEYLNRGPVFAPLRDLNFFRKAYIEGDAIVWPNGADIAPETIYAKCQQAAA